jgi:hypothetical protein
METADSIAVFAVMVAALALAFSTMQWLQSQRERQLGLLLGEKETASYQALRIARRPNARISEDVIRALVLVIRIVGPGADAGLSRPRFPTRAAPARGSGSPE